MVKRSIKIGAENLYMQPLHLHTITRLQEKVKGFST